MVTVAARDLPQRPAYFCIQFLSYSFIKREGGSVHSGSSWFVIPEATPLRNDRILLTSLPCSFPKYSL